MARRDKERRVKRERKSYLVLTCDSIRLRGQHEAHSMAQIYIYIYIYQTSLYIALVYIINVRKLEC